MGDRQRVELAKTRKMVEGELEPTHVIQESHVFGYKNKPRPFSVHKIYVQIFHILKNSYRIVSLFR